MRVTRPVPLLVAACLLAGCGAGTNGGPAKVNGAVDSLTAASALSGAADRTVAARSSKFSLTSTTAVSGQTVHFDITGAFDYARHVGSMTFTLPAALGGSGASLQERLVGDAVYMTLPGQGATFYRLTLAELGGTSLGSGADPTAGLAVLRGATGVRSVGHDVVRGVTTTHYTGTLDINAALAKVGGVIHTFLQKTFANSAFAAVPFDAYLDDQGRLRRMVQHLSLHSASLPGQTVRTVTVVDFYEFGTPVVVVAPPAAQVKDGAPLLAVLGGKAPAHG